MTLPGCFPERMSGHSRLAEAMNVLKNSPVIYNIYNIYIQVKKGLFIDS